MVSTFSPQIILYTVYTVCVTLHLCLCSLFLSPQCSRSCSGGYRVREVRCLADNIAPSDRCDPSLTPESREECNKQPCLAEISKCCTTAEPLHTVCPLYSRWSWVRVHTRVGEDLVRVRFLCDAVIFHNVAVVKMLIWGLLSEPGRIKGGLMTHV